MNSASGDILRLWPLVTIFIFLSVKTPLLLLLGQLPEVLSNNMHITVGGVRLERRLKDAAVSPEVRKSVGTYLQMRRSC